MAMNPENAAKTSEKKSRKPPVNRTNQVKTKPGELVCIENTQTQIISESAQAFNDFLLVRANNYKAVGTEMARAAKVLEENAGNLIGQAFQQEYERLSSDRNRIPGWQYLESSDSSVDFNSTLQQCLTVGTEKPQLMSA